MILNFTVSQDSGYVYQTEFTFEKTNLPSYNNITWDFGDGTLIYNPAQTTVKHKYNYPGIYTVSLSAWNQVGSFEFANKKINVDYYYRDAIQFSNIPSEWSIVGQRTAEPFTISLTSAKINEPISVILHAIGSDSVPLNTLIDKWKFLVPTWKFLDAETLSIIDGPITLSTVPLFLDNQIVGVSATKSFYYIDDNSTINNFRTDPVIITATLSTLNFIYPPESLKYPYYSYSNNETVKAACLCHIYDVLPTSLKITENFLQPIYPYKWTEIPIPVLITCSFDPAQLSAYNFGSTVSATDVFSYPKTNELGNRYPLKITIPNLPLSSYNVEQHVYNIETNSVSSNLYFKAYENNGTISSGYVFTSLTCLTTASTIQIQADTYTAVLEQSGKAEFAFPTGLPINYQAYISHPYENNINIIELNTFSLDNTYAQYFKEKDMLLEGKISTIDVPLNFVDNVSALGGVYPVAFNPANKHLYAADSDSSRIHLYVDKVLTKSLDLSAAVFNIISGLPTANIPLSSIAITPSSLSIDGENNVWVALYDCSLVLKYDTNLTTVLASATPQPPTTVDDLFNDVDSYAGSFYNTPSVVEVDQNNKLWVTYSHPLSGRLVHFNSNGTLQATLSSIVYPINTVPVDVCITKNNNVWVACREKNLVICYQNSNSSSYTNIQALSSFEILKPSYIAVDKQDNLWVLHGYNLISQISFAEGFQFKTWKLENFPNHNLSLIRTNYTTIDQYPSEEINEISQNDEIWGGIAIDVLNRIWFIDSQTNSVFVAPVNNLENYKKVSLIPKATENYYFGNTTQVVETSFVRSAQAVGDWTGNKWYQKFGNVFESYPIKGLSNTFEVKDLLNSTNIAKVNEDFNCTEYFRRLALPELIQNNEKLFNEFLAALVGTGDVTAEEIGRVLYEKIANFVGNHADVETAEIRQLISLLQQVKIESKKYGVSFPAEIERLLNIFSVSLYHLRGVPVYETNPLTNLGEALTLSSLVTATQYLYVKDRFYDTYQIVQVAPEINTGALVYPLSSIQIEGLRGQQSVQGNEILQNYYFFTYNPYEIVDYSGNLIDWKNEATTITYNISSAEDYYKDNGIIDLYFNNLLTKRLFGK